MTDRILWRLSKGCAIAGGLMRVANSFLPRAPGIGLLYFVEDVLLLFGLIGLWLSQRRAAGALGVVGFALTMVGLLSVRSQTLFPYELSAAEILVGLVVLGLPVLRRRPLAPGLWMASLALGLLSFVPVLHQAGTTAAAVTFGAGYVVAGLTWVRD